MGIKEIRQELKSFGVSMVGIFEKSELIDELVKARSKKKTVKTSFSFRGDVAAASSSNPSSMGIKAIRQELGLLGVSVAGFLEKNELVDALVNARREGKKKHDRGNGSGMHGHTSSSHSTISHGEISRRAPIAIDAVP